MQEDQRLFGFVIPRSQQISEADLLFGFKVPEKFRK